MKFELDRMVECDLRDRGIEDERVLQAFKSVDRIEFVNSYDRDRAYQDRALALSNGQTISQPYMVALMLQELSCSGTEKVLEIGTGSGYQTALLAKLCAEVWTVERIEPLATGAEDKLLAMGFKNIHYRWGDGSLGWPEGAPYERIVVSAAAPELCSAWIEQLAPGGILVAPVGPRSGQKLQTVRKEAHDLKVQSGIDCLFVPLIGADGYAAAAN